MSIPASTALFNLRVLDLSRVRAGPTCCRILADLSADVIKIEAGAGVDPNEGMSGSRDGYDMLNLHRNKRPMTLNLKVPTGREIFLKLVKTADVVVKSFRPDVKETICRSITRCFVRSIRALSSPRSPFSARLVLIACARGLANTPWRSCNESGYGEADIDRFRKAKVV
jgi:CoA-transferase family III